MPAHGANSRLSISGSRWTSNRTLFSDSCLEIRSVFFTQKAVFPPFIVNAIERGLILIF